MKEHNVKIFDPCAIAIVLAAPFALFAALAITVGPIFIWQQFKYPKGAIWYKANDNPPNSLSK